MRFHILTLFPEFFDSPLACGLMGKALAAGLLDVSLVNPRDFAPGPHHSVDDRPYGGGPGMVMAPGPLAAALESIERPGRMLLLAPSGRPFRQADARALAREEAVTILCGRYEGIDARLAQAFPLEPVSVGDFVLSGGESAALCVLEAVARLVPGFMGKEESADEESFAKGLLEYPHYTRPEVFRGLPAPETLLSGDHGAIAAWRREQALLTTLRTRPEMLAAAPLSAADQAILRGTARSRAGRNLYLALVHYPVKSRDGSILASSLTNLDVHDIARVSRTYGLGGYYVATPLKDQRRLVDELLAHWTEGAGGDANPDRAEALRLVQPVESLDEAVERVSRTAGRRPRLVATSAGGSGDATADEVRAMLDEEPVLLVFGTASGLAPEVVETCGRTLRPVRFMDRYNHLSVRSAVAVTVDRILQDAG